MEPNWREEIETVSVAANFFANCPTKDVAYKNKMVRKAALAFTPQQRSNATVAYPYMENYFGDNYEIIVLVHEQGSYAPVKTFVPSDVTFHSADGTLLCYTLVTQGLTYAEQEYYYAVIGPQGTVPVSHLSESF